MADWMEVTLMLTSKPALLIMWALVYWLAEGKSE
jgi:hypothetical protein